MSEITRIVRLSFAPENTSAFVEIFKESRDLIRARKGCIHLELNKDIDHANVYYTISRWESPDDLDSYRQSELFKTTWAKTKVLFNDKPVAYSVRKIM